jgi:hypothetical protein
MQAFVQIGEDGEFQKENALSAWRAFNHFGYEVVKYKHADIPRLPITRETPCYGSVKTSKAIFKKLKVEYTELPSYPASLNRFFRRNIYESTVGEVRQIVCAGGQIFAKPLDDHRKMFHGNVFKTERDLIAFGGVPDEWPLIAAEVVKHEIVSEYRVFILKGEVLDARKYRGNYEYAPSSNVIKNMIALYKDAPIAFCLDVGVAINQHADYTFLIETTDAWAFGHYGLDFVHYGNMLVARWNEMCKL